MDKKDGLAKFDAAFAKDLRFLMDHYRDDPMLIPGEHGEMIEPDNVEAERLFAVVAVMGMTYPATGRELFRLVFGEYQPGMD